MRRRARRAVLYYERNRHAIAVSIGEAGRRWGAKVTGFDFGPGVESWVQTMRAYWGWMHPRYRSQ